VIPSGSTEKHLPTEVIFVWHYTVEPGNTLSSIAAKFGESLAVVEQDNPQYAGNWNLIYAGQTVTISGLSGESAPAPAPLVPAASPANVPAAVPAASVPVQQSQAPAAQPAPVQQAPAQQSETGSGGGALSDIPGVPQSFASCVAFRESTDNTNPAADGNAYGIIPASGYNVGGDSLAQQKQVFAQIYNTVGPSAWSADGCPGS
jgi:hypothetical protein